MTDKTLLDLVKDKSMSELNLPTYIHHEEVHAKPMTIGLYCREMGIPLRPGADPDAQGFLVVVDQGGPDETVRWVPKAVFEPYYTKG